ncbi:helix-turn-helix transcriptional regulator [Protofrankia coriariae]|uniref:helix-turn-helix transcriptional regulator n=1 Tax=Protofrankia coriariae TaxID=1562887 RepID=UPI00069A9CDF|nr:LuxR C-terminal-related transcriptional regulator [Protofrankia coriariae]
MDELPQRIRSQRARARAVRGYVEKQLWTELDQRIAAVRAQAPSAGSAGPAAPAGSAGLEELEILVRTADELRACEEQNLWMGDRARVGIHQALGRLRRCASSAELLERVPPELTRACGFARAMISRVHHSEWIPILPPPGVDPDTDAFRRAFGDEPTLPLRHMLLEAEMVRRRIGILVADAASDPRCHEAFVTVAGARSYVGAPLMPSGRVIGFLHADRRGQDHPVTQDDLDNIVLFAEHVGLLYERAVFAEELQHRRARVQAAQLALARDLDAVSNAELRLQLPPTPEDDPDDDHRDSTPPPGRIALLSTREREVLDLIVAGETNSGIARELVLGEQTVKTHVARVLRKLGATSRAEAAARYLRMRGR